MSVALVQCPVWGTREPPLGIVQLAGSLKKRGCAVSSYDVNNRLYRRRLEGYENLWAWEQSLFWYDRGRVSRFFSDIESEIASFVDEILSRDPSLVAFSVAASSFAATAEIARRIRRISRAHIVFGGQAFVIPDAVSRAFRETVADSIVAGEGDVTLPDLAEYIAQGKDIRECPGLTVRTGADGFQATPPRPLLADLDELAFMDFTDLRIDDYDDNRHISLMASRGCVWRCAFCSSCSFWKGYRWMSGRRIYDEVLHVRGTQSVNTSHIDFADLCFNGNMERVEDFVDLMLESPPQPATHPFNWLANAIVHPGLTADLLTRMRAAGCQRLIFGIESGSEQLRRLMGKPYKTADARRIFRDAAMAGIKVTANFMFGFPGETEDDFAQTLDFVRDVAPYVDRVYPSRTYCAMEENSRMFSHAAEFGVRVPINHHLYWETTDGSNTYPVRLERCQRFERVCEQEHVTVDSGVRITVELDEYFNLAQYYEHAGQFRRAAEFYLKHREKDADNAMVLELLRSCQNKFPAPVNDFDRELDRRVCRTLGDLHGNG